LSFFQSLYTHINAVTAVYIRLEILSDGTRRLAPTMSGGGKGMAVVRTRFADEIQYRAINGC